MASREGSVCQVCASMIYTRGTRGFGDESAHNLRNHAYAGPTVLRMCDDTCTS